MTKEDIVQDWLSIESNRRKIPSIVYKKEVYEFILATATIYYFTGHENNRIFYVNTIFQIPLKENNQ